MCWRACAALVCAIDFFVCTHMCVRDNKWEDFEGQALQYCVNGSCLFTNACEVLYQ